MDERFATNSRTQQPKIQALMLGNPVCGQSADTCVEAAQLEREQRPRVKQTMKEVCPDCNSKRKEYKKETGKYTSIEDYSDRKMEVDSCFGIEAYSHATCHVFTA